MLATLIGSPARPPDQSSALAQRLQVENREGRVEVRGRVVEPAPGSRGSASARQVDHGAACPSPRRGVVRPLRRPAPAGQQRQSTGPWSGARPKKDTRRRIPGVSPEPHALAQLGRQRARRRRGRAAGLGRRGRGRADDAAAAGRRVRPIGSGHSFTGIGRPEDVQLTCERLVGLGRGERGRAGHRRRGNAAAPAQRRARAARGSLTNLGDIDRQTIAGRPRHRHPRHGREFGGLATQVRGLQLVAPSGEVIDCDATRRPELFTPRGSVSARWAWSRP